MSSEAKERAAETERAALATVFVLVLSASAVGCGRAEDVLTTRARPGPAGVSTGGSSGVSEGPDAAQEMPSFDSGAPPVTAPQIAVSDSEACTVRKDGTLWCWGTDSLLGERTVATQVGTDSDWTSVALVSYVAEGNVAPPWIFQAWTCGTKRNGALECWGDPSIIRSLAGLALLPSRSEWSKVSFVTVDAPGTYGDGTGPAPAVGLALLTRRDGTLWGFGQSNVGQLGGVDITVADAPVLIAEDSRQWLRTSSSAFGTCGVATDGSLWCVGDSFLTTTHGPGLTTPPLLDACTDGGKANCNRNFVQVDPGHDWADVAVGPSYAMAVKANGELWCWGITGAGQCGGQYFWRADVPTLTDANAWKQVSPGASGVCGVRRDATLWCWGNGGGIPGAPYTPITDPITSGIQVEASHSWSEVLGNCAIEVGGAVWCWGSGEQGQIGDGRKTSSTTLVRVLGF